MIVVSREAWDSEDTDPWEDLTAMPEVYIHHVAGRTPTSPTDEIKHMHELQRRAIDVKKYRDMDYNVAIGPSGTVYEGRGLFARSAATLDRNDVSRSIVLMGNTDINQPTAAQLATLPKLIVHLIEIGALAGKVTILGHYQNPEHLNATVCPGRYMKPHLDDVRSDVAALLAPRPEPIPALPVEEDAEMPVGKLIQCDDKDPAVLVRYGERVTSAVSVQHIRAGQAAGSIEALDDLGRILKVSRLTLRTLEYFGSLPDYSNVDPAQTGRTRSTDFARCVL